MIQYPCSVQYSVCTKSTLNKCLLDSKSDAAEMTNVYAESWNERCLFYVHHAHGLAGVRPWVLDPCSLCKGNWSFLKLPQLHASCLREASRTLWNQQTILNKRAKNIKKMRIMIWREKWKASNREGWDSSFNSRLWKLRVRRMLTSMVPFSLQLIQNKIGRRYCLIRYKNFLAGKNMR